MKMDEPMLDLKAFKYPMFVIGLLLIFSMHDGAALYDDDFTIILTNIISVINVCSGSYASTGRNY